MAFKKIRYYIFLRDVGILSLTAFGGPQAHLGMFQDMMVRKRNYLSEDDLMELYALCQILPGPTSTQTLTAIGFKIGGPSLAYLTLLVWMTPAVLIMTMTGVLFNYLYDGGATFNFTKYIQPMAVGIVSVAAYRITMKVVNTKLGMVILLFSAVSSFFVKTPYIFPLILFLGGLITTINYRKQPVEEKTKMKIDWRNFLLWGGVFIFSASLGGLTKSIPELLPIRLFENFYRSGSLIFGGGQVLIPLLYTEFVEFKDYLTGQEFLSGFSLVQSLPGPVFSFSAYVGALSMRDLGVSGEIIGGIVSAIAIFLPGTFLIFFVTRFWDSLKKYRRVRASLEGVHAASAGMVAAAAILLFQPLPDDLLTYAITFGTFCLLIFTKLPTPVLILLGLAAGFIF